MPTATHEELIRRWFREVWNERRHETINELLAEDCVLHGLGPDVKGRAGFEQMHAAFCAALPDIRITTQFAFSNGDFVVAHNRVEGTHRGVLFGIPPSNRRVEFTGSSIGRLENGRFVEVWDEYNFLELYSQLDALVHIDALRKAAAANNART